MHFKNDVPFDKMYQASRKEASRKKPVFFIHKYFARRITSNFRMVLLDYFESENLYDDFYSKSKDQGKGIVLLDPFMGGGTTIFEALRLGFNVVGNDLQPLSYFVTKALIEPMNKEEILLELRKLEEKVGNRIKNMYITKCPICGESAEIMYCFHVKKTTTNNCHKEHKFFSSFIIALKGKEFTLVCPDCGKLHKTTFEKGTFYCDCGWELTSPKNSYINKGVFCCPECGEQKALTEYVNDGKYPFLTDIIAIEYYCPHCNTHDYKSPDKEDIQQYQKCCEEYEHLKKILPIPKERIPKGHNTNQILNHGYKYFKDLFNPRQLLGLGLLLAEINKIEDENTHFWFQLAFSGMLEMNNMFCRYQQNAYKICNIFFNHAYVPITMPVENCIWGTKLGTGTLIKTLNKIIRGKEFNNQIYDISVIESSKGKYKSIKVFNGDNLNSHCVADFESIDTYRPLLSCSDSKVMDNIPDNSVDLVVTDPPYGANVMYSELIDFFHCWNYMSSRAKEFGFTTPLSPKKEEIVVNEIAGKDFDDYKSGITEVFKQCYKKGKENSYLVFSFHDKSIDSWVAIMKSIRNSGYKLIKTYPVQSETRTGAHTSGKNSIGIDMMLICIKTDNITIEKQLDYTCLRNETLSETKFYVERLQSVNAEITLPDIENISIALYFKNYSHTCNAFNIDKTLIDNITDLIKTIDYMSEDFNVTEKRSGWWSELFTKKWNL